MTEIKLIPGGVCAAQGFTGSGIHCGIRKNRTKRDLALILSSVPASAAAVYTTNLVKGAPLEVTKKHLADGKARAVICNSGNANTCNADGIEIAEETCELLAKELGIAAEDVIVASTGVIGQRMSIEPFKTGIPPLCAALGKNSEDVAEAIMTTDTRLKEVAVEFTAGGKTCKLGGIAKGSGMIHPNMATMLVFITTDCAISPEMLQKALSADVQNTFNMISVDGDTSTNDMVAVMANGLAGNAEITTEGEDFESFMKALNTVTVHLCRCIAGDGEGATKLLECLVTGALDEAAAKTVARSVICSSLLKAAMFGADANWAASSARWATPAPRWTSTRSASRSTPRRGPYMSARTARASPSPRRRPKRCYRSRRSTSSSPSATGRPRRPPGAATSPTITSK